jgi:hypothetical protein
MELSVKKSEALANCCSILARCEGGRKTDNGNVWWNAATNKKTDSREIDTEIYAVNCSLIPPALG